jgi:hypothetical protein
MQSESVMALSSRLQLLGISTNKPFAVSGRNGSAEVCSHDPNHSASFNRMWLDAFAVTDNYKLFTEHINFASFGKLLL